MKRSLFLVLIALSALTAQAQDILTAEKFLASVGERYAQVKDYSGRLVIKTGRTEMRGTVLHKAPSLLRIDFTQPEDQVIAFNGSILTVYLPEYRAVLSQEVNTDSKASGASLASGKGLSILRRNYACAYESGPSAVPLDEGSSEMVIKLVLTRRSLSEGFRELRISINPETKLIRRIVGRSISDDVITFEFSDLVLNQGIPEGRFAYDVPPSANLYNDFLFRDND